MNTEHIAECTDCGLDCVCECTDDYHVCEPCKIDRAMVAIDDDATYYAGLDY